MRAQAGDWLLVKGTIVGSPDELGQILEVRGRDGEPPFLVRWLRDDHKGLVFPGPDAVVLTAREKSAADERQRRQFERAQEEIRAHAAHIPAS
ncbi:DUF1918 domain-containing protein [Prauserella flavalba]|uniref:DUF1918 domain-containing protein n=1 Tax=Prauserella flavalba TaxID=1477506 RepID=A0A318MCC6_9PSEU|nr:DUF1918 domain-containing protein [Prauserella flavalba]PXY36519.1 hypothetical protein BA062_14115 [Prauserella flavalba]